VFNERVRSKNFPIVKTCLLVGLTVFLAGCSRAGNHSSPAISSNEPQDNQFALAGQKLIDPAELSRLLKNPLIAQKNFGPNGLDDARQRLLACSMPLRGSLSWTTDAKTFLMYDLSTYENSPGTMDGLINLAVTWNGHAPSGIDKAREGLDKCNVPSRIQPLRTTTGPLQAIHFTMGHPLKSEATLVFRQDGKTTIVILLSHPSNTTPEKLTDGLVPAERRVLEAILHR
jgi:hypothetical protein